MTDVRIDGWSNVTTGLGVHLRDKRMSAHIGPSFVPNWQHLENIFVGDPLAKRICQLPPREKTREWLHIKSDNDEAAKAHMQRQQELGVQSAVYRAEVWARVYGGGVILIGADDGVGRDLDQPLNETNIRTLQWLTVLERRHLEVATKYTDIFGPKYGEPKTYRINGSSVVDVTGRSFGQEVHESRLIRFDGVLTPIDRIVANNGWNDSIFVALADTIRDTWGGFNGAAALLQDFSQAVYKMQGLEAAMSEGQSSLVLNRLRQIDFVRSLMRAVVIDQNETFERTPTPVTGMPELLDRLQQILSAVTGIPATKLWGRAPAGLNATGDSDTRNWYDDIAAEQKTELRPKLQRLFRLMWLAKDGPTGGVEPESWDICFNPLWQPTAQEQATTRKLNSDADQVDITSGVLHPEEVRQSRYGGGAYGQSISLDPEYDAPETRGVDPESDKPVPDPTAPADHHPAENEQ